MLNPAIALRPRILVFQGDFAAARAWVQERGLGEDDEPAHPREPEYLALARVLLAEHAPNRASVHLERIASAAQARGRAGSLIDASAPGRRVPAGRRRGPGLRGACFGPINGAARGLRPGLRRRGSSDGGNAAASRRQPTRPSAKPPVPIDYIGRILRAVEGPAPRTSLQGRSAQVAG